MTTLYALIKDATGRVVNITPSRFDVPEGWSLIECPENTAIDDTYDGGTFIHNTPAPTGPTLEEVRATKLAEINAACDAILNAAVQTYPEMEVLTFDQQTSEAKAYLASGNASDAPLLSALATGRGITLDDLVQRVIAKHTAFSALSGYVIGQRQALEDRLDACTTVAEIEAITVDIALPDMTGVDV